LYRVLLSGLSADNLGDLYPFVPNPGDINASFLGFIDLTKKNIPLALIAGALQFFQTKMLTGKRPPPQVRKTEGGKDEDLMASMNRSMTYMMPVMTVFIGASLPGGLTLYWVAINAFSIVQQAIAFRKTDTPKPAPPAGTTPSAV
jgi:YidC/Oxa1 family membrane protein insertase